MTVGQVPHHHTLSFHHLPSLLFLYWCRSLKHFPQPPNLPQNTALEILISTCPLTDFLLDLLFKFVFIFFIVPQMYYY